MTDINIGAISEALNDKSDRDLRNVDNTAGADAVIEYQEPNAGNNYIWYRKYKSGWVEQGQFSYNCPHNSVQTITLPVEMASSNYVVNTFGIQISSSGSFGAASTLSGAPKSTTQIYVGQQNASSATMRIGWEVKGVAAS